MRQPSELYDLFTGIGCPHVYFQPPENIKIKYPCIIYERDSGLNVHADDNPYLLFQRYVVTLIDKDPNSKFIEKLQGLQFANYNRHFVSDNLYHDVFYIY